MGRQINFYFDCKDESALIHHISIDEVAILRMRELKLPRCEEYTELNMAARSETLGFQTVICFRGDLKKIKFLEIEGGGFYFIDAYGSPVIEFSPSGYRAESNTLVAGRLWYEHKYWTKDEDGNDVLMEKSKELEKLYNSLARWIRKHCTRLPNGNYIGPHAMKLYEKGAQLS